LLGVPRELAEHSLDVSKTAKPLKQKLCLFAKDHKEVIRVEALKLLTARFIRECKNPVWLLGFMVSHHDIEANPAKVDAIRKMNQPTGKKDVMKLTGMMVVLARFISKLGEKGQPFFKLLKQSDKFKWIDEVDQKLEELKTFLMMPSVMVPPAPKETLLLYISASTQVVSAVLVAERPEEGHQYPVQ
jgi:hypothetical protein